MFTARAIFGLPLFVLGVASGKWQEKQKQSQQMKQIKRIKAIVTADSQLNKLK